MTKQQFLDREPENTIEAAMQELLKTLNKTNATSCQRSIKLIYKTLYKTSMRNLTLTEISEALDVVEEYIKQEANE